MPVPQQNKTAINRENNGGRYKVQELPNGGRCDLPLPRLKTPFNVKKLPPSLYENIISYCQIHLDHLELLSLPEEDADILRQFYLTTAAYYQNKIDTAHAYLIDVQSPTLIQ